MNHPRSPSCPHAPWLAAGAPCPACAPFAAPYVARGAAPPASPHARWTIGVLAAALSLSLAAHSAVFFAALSRAYGPLVRPGPALLRVRARATPARPFAPAYVAPALALPAAAPSFARPSYGGACGCGAAPGTIASASVLARAGAPTTNPWELLARARRLAAHGFPLRVYSAHYDPAQLAQEQRARRDAGFLARVEPRADGGRAVRFLRVAPDSLVARLGLHEGDQLVAVNGAAPLEHRAAGPWWGARGARPFEPTVLELERAGQRVVLVHARGG